MKSDSLRQLTEIMPPHAGAGDVVDWTAAEATLGVSFPQDYRDFVATYGAGTISDALFVFSSLPTEPKSRTIGRLPKAALQAPEMHQWQSPGAGAHHHLSDMFVWGETDGADALCWLTVGDSPEEWPLAVWSRHGGGWQLYRCGMVDFLLKIFRADFAECPLSSTSLWGDTAPHFLHWREEDRLRDAGLNPWTGEPDDFAGMDLEFD
ncbi:hypothetical protein ADL22_29295 [Streptomyces sp. NRRL F-4489]|uniref:SMI1/KNR4 family protein n=1 Tax=Streptomyces sp. NRRL F-4489 TaxID=1609095 RepID=UPI00074720DB|nr:SMI1/KNR4 family protein [Streptomyces sp. NRRL F-4489]KUL34919.1 hypothetical protein ADL22_29295 [Streptomyces sp. NRRL F-4489]